MTTKIITVVITAAFVALSFTGCQKKEFDAYYERPAGLEGSIYQQLQDSKHFKHLLALVDKAGYTTTLNTAGYWTLFAPNDAAFEAFFKEKGIASVEDIDSATALSIVQYALVYNAFKANELTGYQVNGSSQPNNAFKRKTAYYDFVYSENNRQVIAANRNGSYLSSDNNNKYIPYFISAYLDAKRLSAADYNYFYPTAVYSGFNVANASVVNKDMVAENGVVHELDKVVTPLLSLDQYLASKPEYSEFKKILDQYMVSYGVNANATSRYEALTKRNDPVYVKLYSASLAFSPNNENFLKLQENDGQSDGYTLFVPANDVLLNYANNVLLQYYPVKNINQLPINIITDFLNAHLWRTTVWPSKFGATLNTFGEEARFDAQANITDKKILSNGFFYGTNKVQEANVFHSVYGKAYLNPAYSLMNRALDLELKATVSNPNLRFALLLIPNAVFTQNGFAWNTANNTFQYTAPGGSPVIGGEAVTRLKRLLSTHIVPYTGRTAPDFSGEGIVETYDGEYIKFKNGKVFSAGTLDNTVVANQSINIDSLRPASNGTGYYTNGLLTYSDVNIGKHIEKYAATASDPYYRFFQYLKSNTSVYNASTGAIQGVLPGVFYTVFIPSNAAIQDAVNNGWLPASATPTASDDIEKVTRFLQYHILSKNTVVPDGLKQGKYETLLKDQNGNVVTVEVVNTPGNLQLIDVRHVTPTATVLAAGSNVLSNRTVIHQIDTYLQYQY